MLLGRQTVVGPNNYVLDVDTYERHLGNTIELSVLGGRVGCRYPITVATCCFHVWAEDLHAVLCFPDSGLTHYISLPYIRICTYLF